MEEPIQTYVVPPESDGQRLDRFLVTIEPERSRSQLHALIGEGRVLVDGKVRKPSFAVRPGSSVEVRYPVEQLFPTAEDRALDILFEDDILLVLNKPAGMSVHPVKMEEEGTLVQALLHHSHRIAEAIYDPESALSRMRPGIVHRLDKDTTGVMVVAKTADCLHALAKQFHDHSVVKEYQALVFGSLTDPTTVHTNIGRKPMRRNLMGIKPTGGEDGKEAISHFEPEQQYFWKATGQEASLVRCRIETGRTHQIRVHAKHIGHPVLGDPVYFTKPSLTLTRHLGAKRQLLHASKLVLDHPETDERMTFVAPLASDMQAALLKIQSPS